MITLQVFVNKSSVAWKRLSTVSASTVSSSDGNSSSPLMTFGCDSNGGWIMEGRLDSLAYWSWRLTDEARDGKPTDGTNLSELEYFDGDLQFSSSPNFCYGPKSCLPGVDATLPSSTTQASAESNPFEQVPPYQEDIATAIDGGTV